MLRPGNKKESAPSEHESDEDEDHEDDSLTAAEEAELDQLESEFSTDPSSSKLASPLSNSSPQKRRWFWWWRWHLNSDSAPQSKSSKACGKQSDSSSRE
jgi:hypothetical protein